MSTPDSPPASPHAPLHRSLAQACPPGAVPKDRIAWVDVAKGISILLVVLLHAHVYLNPLALSVDFYSFVNSAFRPVRMPLFFALSGVLAASLIRKDWATVTEKRLWQLVYVFALWSLVHIVLYKYFLWHPFATFDASLPQEWIYNLVHPARTGIWFIWALAFYLVFTRALRRLPYLAVGLALVAGVLGETNLPTQWGWITPPQAVLRYLPFFVIPALIGRDVLTAATRHPLALLLGGMMVVLATKLLPDLWPGRLDGGALMLIRSTGGLGVGLGAAVFLSRIGVMRSFLSYFGRRTLPIYLMHNLVLAVLAMTLVGTQMPGLPLIAVPLCTVLAVLVSLVLDHLLKQIGAQMMFQPFPLSRRAQLG